MYAPFKTDSNVSRRGSRFSENFTRNFRPLPHPPRRLPHPLRLFRPIQRVFQYHGAEHKTINAFEAGAALTPESVAKFPLEHPRCGTSFLLTLLILSIFAFSLLHPLAWVWQVAGRILLIPILAGIAVEYIRWTANNLASPFVRAIIRPNFALQGLTTREPDASMLEVAIRSFEEMRKAEVQ